LLNIYQNQNYFEESLRSKIKIPLSKAFFSVFLTIFEIITQKLRIVRGILIKFYIGPPCANVERKNENCLKKGKALPVTGRGGQ
jgi:hypothetical protein